MTLAWRSGGWVLLWMVILACSGAHAQSTGGGPSVPREKPLVRVCTGPEGGNYQQAVFKLMAQAKERIRFELVDPTAGSLDNIDFLLDGKCDISPVQKDALLVRALKRPEVSNRITPMGTLYKETVHMVCNKQANVSRVTYLRDDKYPVAIGSAGGGSSITWDAFIAADNGYSKAPTRPISGIQAIEAAKLGGDVTCFLFTSALKSPSMMEADSVAEGKLELIAVDDGDFADAKDPKTNQPIYNYVYIPSGTYPHLQSGRVKSVQVDAIWAARTDFIDQNPRVYEELLRAKNRAAPDILAMVGQTAQ